MKLSPCKHCGSPAHLTKAITDPHLCWSVACQSCGITTAQYSQQDDAVAAWQRVAYQHRNGETARPTQSGRFWFDGICATLTGDIGLRLILDVTVPDGMLLAWEERTAEYLRLDRFDGVWWGPVVAPWE